jgi:hypothetical protein
MLDLLSAVRLLVWADKNQDSGQQKVRSKGSIRSNEMGWKREGTEDHRLWEPAFQSTRGKKIYQKPGAVNGKRGTVMLPGKILI